MLQGLCQAYAQAAKILMNMYDNVAYVHQNGLMVGTSADMFSPDLGMTRSMIFTILYRHAGSPGVSGADLIFSDVALGTWYTDGVKWAAENGIVYGIGDDRFAPDDMISLQDLAAILMRYAEAMDIVLPKTVEAGSFSDSADIADYARYAVIMMQSAEIIKGKPGNIFDPLGQVTRGEAAAMLHRFTMAIQ